MRSMLRSGLGTLGIWWLFFTASGLVMAAPVAEGPAAPPNMITGARAQREVVVGAYASNYPYSYRETPDGPLTGFTVELLDELAAAMNLRVRRVELPNEEVQRRFRAGEFDMLQMLSESKGREEWADFSVPILYVQNVVFVRRDDRAVRSLADLHGRRFAVAGTTSASELFLRLWEPEPRITEVGSAEEALRLVDEGRADAVLLSRLTALSLIEHLGLTNVVELPDPAAYLEIRHCFAVHKGDTLLLARLNEGLAVLHRTGAYGRIYRKWFGRFEPARFSREEVITYVAGALALAFLAALWGFLRQRSLRRRIDRQGRELGEQEGLLRVLFDNVPLGMCVVGGDATNPHLLSINRRARDLLGVQDAVQGRQALTGVPLSPEWRDCLVALFAEWRPEAGPVVREQAMAQGRRHLVLTLVPLRASPGAPARCCLLVDDISDRRRLDEELARSRRLRALGELVGGIAHEFNNLMTPVLINTSLIEMLRIENQDLKENVGTISVAARRAAELTRRLLAFGRKGAEKAVAVRLREAVTGAIHFLQPTFDRRIVWDNAVPEGLLPLHFNATDLHQILVNLLLNARDTLLERLAANTDSTWVPRIRLEARQLPADQAGLPTAIVGAAVLGWQRLTIADNGQGMSPEVRERIFEPFFTTKDVGAGTGLGLATVWHLVTAAGGRVEVETTAGEGTAFHVLLPVVAVPEPAGPELAAAAESRVAAVRILLVEDDELVARAIGGVLKLDGHTVQRLAEGDEAWRHLQNRPHDYDLLVLDINIPGIDGLELVRRARQAGFAGRILVVSGRAVSRAAVTNPAARIDRVLLKPFTVEELRAALRECLAQSSGGPELSPNAGEAG